MLFYIKEAYLDMHVSQLFLSYLVCDFDTGIILSKIHC